MQKNYLLKITLNLIIRNYLNSIFHYISQIKKKKARKSSHVYNKEYKSHWSNQQIANAMFIVSHTLDDWYESTSSRTVESKKKWDFNNFIYIENI